MEIMCLLGESLTNKYRIEIGKNSEKNKLKTLFYLIIKSNRVNKN